MTTNKNNNGKIEHRRQEVQQAVKNACDQLNSDGVTPRDYVEQLVWLFFLKAFDEAETRHEQEAAFDDRSYSRRLDGDFRWSAWSKRVERPGEMLEFVDGKLWHHLQNFGLTDDTKQFAGDPVVERFRRIFSTVRNHSRRGASFARVVQQVNRLHFSDETDVIVLSQIYEDLLKRVASDSAGYAGEFYTQRHIIRAMVEVVQPTIGDRAYDPGFGTAGFLSESAEYIRLHSGTLSGKDLETLNHRTFFGVELKPLTYLLGIMNMLLHRIEGANLELANTLEFHSANVSEQNRYNVILSNPPYGGKLARELRNEAVYEAKALLPSSLETVFDELAATHETTPIDSVLSDSRYGTSRKCDAREDAVPVLRIPNIADGQIAFSDLKYCKLEQKELERLILEPGDLLVVWTTGSPDLVGRCAVFDSSSRPFAFASYLIRLRVDPEKADPHFLAFFLASTHGRDAIAAIRRTSAGQYNINSENLRSIQVSLPPIGEQKRLADQLREQQSVVRAIAADQVARLDETEYLRAAVLRKAFAGEL